MITSKADAMLPVIKRKLVSTILAYCVVVEVAPLLTAMLMAGRIGGSHSGEVATMHSSGQHDLLRTLGVRARLWTLIPSIISAVIVAPILTFILAVSAVSSAAYFATASEFVDSELLVIEHNSRVLKAHTKIIIHLNDFFSQGRKIDFMARLLGSNHQA
jgi:ABC-type transporter Mla maintaining outer membrane lipid asymmetry permease subunit MlaE